MPLRIKRYLLAGVFSLFSFHVNAKSDYPGTCTTPLFYAETVNHKRTVEVCSVGDVVYYGIGAKGAEHKEIEGYVEKTHTEFSAFWPDEMAIRRFEIYDRGMTYSIYTQQVNDVASAVQGRAVVDVYRGDRHVDEIDLDTAGIYWRTQLGFVDEGIPESEEL